MSEKKNPGIWDMIDNEVGEWRKTIDDAIGLGTSDGDDDCDCEDDHDDDDD